MDPGFLQLAEDGKRYSLAEYLAAYTARADIANAMARFHEKYDLLLTPQMPIPALEVGHVTPPDGSYGDRWIDWSPYTYPFNLTQQPAASVPCGFSSDGLPIGLQIVGPARHDHLVLRAARAFESARPFRFSPRPKKGPYKIISSSLPSNRTSLCGLFLTTPGAAVFWGKPPPFWKAFRMAAGNSLGGTLMAKLNINGKIRDVQVEADTPLLWVIREQVGLTGTKYGCGVAQCGACSVHINGEVHALLLDPRRRREGDRQDRHHRGPLGQHLASGAEGLGRRSTCRNAATASPARSWRPRRCSRRTRSRPTPTSTRR